MFDKKLVLKQLSYWQQAAPNKHSANSVGKALIRKAIIIGVIALNYPPHREVCLDTATQLLLLHPRRSQPRTLRFSLLPSPGPGRWESCHLSLSQGNTGKSHTLGTLWVSQPALVASLACCWL